ncbi:hypothetical protein BOTBODRAFT_456001 [Botryobasidium botryosum FD-172 SS1]|uniref:Protein kinase domain-containing protein n=1 Tax=Botryobasidium botryosum (strain FD-172 SS1) TaxID=930990 RepID=A0A067M6R7_BOTB1|nr:hypothetical protein BOTBODRAFT_456001 [Botryobasidium botryosum FD-172 SS1]
MQVGPRLRTSRIAFLSSIYSAHKRYPVGSVLHGCEIAPMKPEKSGEGGFSDCWEGVFLGRHKVAMKTLRAHLADEAAERRLKRETNVWSRLNHPNVLPFIGLYISAEPRSYMISPWMENGHALDYLKLNPETDRVQLLIQVAAGLSYLHGLEPPVVHGDLKANNIFITSPGIARIADFGLSEIVEGASLPRCSTEWFYAGSPRWQAPELLNAETKHDARRTKETDCFAYGRAMLEMFTGYIPFAYLSGGTMSVYEIAARGDFPERPVDKDVIARGLDDSMWRLMENCWNIDPKERPSVASIVSRLSAATALGTRARDDGSFDSSAASSSRKRARRLSVIKSEET